MKRLYQVFFFFLIFQIIQCDFPCRQTFRPAPNYTSIFLKFPPTHSTPRHFFLPTRSRCVPLLCCVCSKWQFISIFIISSVPSMITSMNALPFEREMKGAKRDEFIPPRFSFSLTLSLNISDVCLAWSSQAYGNGASADGKEPHRQSR